ncbi:MAG TPA: CHAT domain-containing protein [Thermomicrobiales bacterium]|nr:CHAT domain-containing protein [Thermomicrobiales bacterium]
MDVPDLPVPGVQYRNFDLLIRPERERTWLVEARSREGEASERTRLRLSRDRLDHLLDRVELAILRSRGGQRRVVAASEQPVQELGRLLFETFVVGEVLSLYDLSWRDASRADSGLRIRLQVAAPQLATLPWEYLYDPRQDEYVCLNRRKPLVRYLQVAQPVAPLMVTPPLRILAMAVNPADADALAIDRESALMVQALGPLLAAGKVQLDWVHGGTWRDLQVALRAGHWHVFHYIGHGGFDHSRGEGVIGLVDETNRTRELPASDLVIHLADHPSLRLVLLNSCEGATASREDLFSSTAALLARRLPAVLAMQYPISDTAAIEFSRTFYGAVADNQAIDTAVAEARKALHTELGPTAEWGTPVLYLHAADGVLFGIVDAPSARAERREVAAGVGARSAAVADPGRLEATVPRERGFAAAAGGGAANPFTYGRPIVDPARFVGRRREVAQVFSRLGNVAFESSSLVGERRIGKTSLLLHLAHPAVRRAHGLDPERYLCLYLDLQLVDAAMTPARLWRWLLQQLARACPDPEVAGALEALCAAESLDSLALDELFDVVDARDRYVVLLLDEFEQVTANPNFGPDFFYGLRSLAIHHHLALVTASRRDLVDLCHSEAVRSSPFFNIFATIPVPLLDEPEEAALLDAALAGTGVAFGAAERAALGRLAGRHPYFLQVAGHALFGAHSEGLDPAARLAALERAFRAATAPHLAEYWRQADLHERIVLAALACLARAEGGDGRGARGAELRALYPHADRALARLVGRGLVVARGEGYAPVTPVFGDWVIDELARPAAGPPEGGGASGALDRALPRLGGPYRDLARAWAGDPPIRPAVVSLLQRALGGEGQ